VEEFTLMNLYKKTLELLYNKQSAHVGSNLSVIPILYDLYKKLKENDVVILSKGHAAIAMYATLLLKGIATQEEIDANWCGHITTKIPGIIWATGSLGHGLPIAIGMAIASPEKNIYVILSDGELDEGSTMEAIKYIDQNPLLPNLKVLVDDNGFSATKKTMPSHFEEWEIYKVYRSTKGCKFLPASMRGLISHYKKLTEEAYKYALESIKILEEEEEENA